MKMKRVNIAIVGAGNVANAVHIPTWKKISMANVVAVCDVNEELVKSVAKIWKIPHFYTDFTELLEKEDNDVVIDICTPPSTHSYLSTKAMSEGHSVVLEKPMAMNYEECKSIMDEYYKRKEEVKLCIIHNFLFTNPLLEIKSVLNKNRICILSVDIRMLHTADDEMISDKAHWVHKLPGGRFGENLIHPIYILRNFIGKLNVRDVYASKMGDYEWVNYDELYATFDSEDGKYGTIHISFNSPRTTVAPISIKIYGKQMIINYDGSNLILTTQGPMPHGKIYKVKDNLQFTLQIAKSLFKETLRAILSKNKSGHEYLFSSFTRAILWGEKMPYAPEEAYDATITFLKVLQNINVQTINHVLRK